MKMASDRKEGRDKEASAETEIQAKKRDKANVKRDYKH